MRLVGLFAALVVLFHAIPALSQATSLIVGADGDYTTIDAALAAARDGDTIEVHGGVYTGQLTVDKSVTLVGVGGPVIDGEGTGSLVLITAPDVLFQGFTLRNTGTNQNHEDTAIVVQAQNVTVTGNRLENVLFGIYFAEANHGVATHNIVHGNQSVSEGIRGDAFRVYYSTGVLLEGNESSGTRDTLIWYANNITIRNNRFHNSRYGLHFMFSQDAVIEDNHFENNSVGAYLMYSAGLTMRDNEFVNNRGPSGYGVAFKDMDNIRLEDNVIAGNRAGLYMDNSPVQPDTYNTITHNLFVYNDIGIAALPAVARNIFRANTFLDNAQQVSVQGRGNLQRNLWSDEGVGNFWSDYSGYDAGGDGIGDVAYRSEKLFDSLVDTWPALRLFLYSPATQALDFAAAAFPLLRPDPKLIDEQPLLEPVIPAQVAGRPTPVSAPMAALSLLLIALGGGLTVWAIGPRRRARGRAVAARQPASS